MDAIFEQRTSSMSLYGTIAERAAKASYARRHDVILLYAKRSGQHSFNADPIRTLCESYS